MTDAEDYFLALRDFVLHNEPGAVDEIERVERAFLGGTLEELGEL
jgi:hypothetical protein